MATLHMTRCSLQNSMDMQAAPVSFQAFLNFWKACLQICNCQVGYAGHIETGGVSQQTASNLQTTVPKSLVSQGPEFGAASNTFMSLVSKRIPSTCRQHT